MKIGAEIRRESRSYLAALVDLHALGGAEAASVAGPRIAERDELGLLEQLLAERMEDHLENLFGLLALLHPPAHVWGAYYSLVSPESRRRGHALEYLDNTLAGEVRRDVFAVIDDQPFADKLVRARALFDLEPEPKVETLRRMIRAGADGGSEATYLACASLYTVHTGGVSDLYPDVEALCAGPADPFVGETAAWVARRHDLRTAP